MVKTEPRASNFIEAIVESDIAEGRAQSVRTRFPPEPSGYLHIGHVKGIVINYGTAEKYGGKYNLRFDDTNPAKEETEFVENIINDIRWMGYEWEHLYFASDFFDELYEIAVRLIKSGAAYVDDQTPEQVRKNRGTLTSPGVNSPYRERGVEENLDLFTRMKMGEFPDGSRVLRAKLDMASPNMLMRDPALYRILRCHHHRTGDKWCIYPMYDFQHPLQDAIEGISHSMCDMGYEIHRPLYDWVVREAGFVNHPPRQIEYARLNITRTIMSKRYLRRLVDGGHVAGWDDPRMPTLAAMRRRGYTPEAIRSFIERVGVAKADSIVDGALLEHCVRDDLSGTAPRAMAVLDPVKVTLSNWPEGRVERLTIENHAERPEMGERIINFAKELYIEREDFMEDPPKKFFRLSPGREVRLKGAYIIRCEEIIKDDAGGVAELICSADLSSKSGGEGASRKVKGTLHWLSAMDARPIEARLYEPILNDEGIVDEEPETDGEAAPAAQRPAKDFLLRLNPDSLKTMQNALAEPVIADAAAGSTFQFLRLGYFCKDPDSTPGRPVYNRTVALKDTWAKVK